MTVSEIQAAYAVAHEPEAALDSQSSSRAAAAAASGLRPSTVWRGAPALLGGTAPHPFGCVPLPFGAPWGDDYEQAPLRRAQRYLLHLADGHEVSAEQLMATAVAARTTPVYAASGGFPQRFNTLLLMTIEARRADIYRAVAKELGDAPHESPGVAASRYAAKEMPREWVYTREHWARAVQQVCYFIGWATGTLRDHVWDTSTGLRAPELGCSLPWGGLRDGTE